MAVMSWKHPKIWIPAIVVLLFVIVLLQNTAVVTLRVLFWDVSMSQVILIPLVLTIGFALGFAAAKLLGARRQTLPVDQPPIP
ncbi:MAG: LapA family protein [Candidatus Binatia bacterium]